MNAPLEFDLAIRCGWLLTMKEGSEAPLRDVLVGIRASKIAYVGSASDREWQAKKVIDASSKIVMPGLINGHTHLPMSLFRGLADDLPFEEWLHKYILPLEARLVSPEFVRTGTELAALELIQRGITTVCDMYYFEDEIADVIDKAGMRGLLGETVADFPQPDDRERTGENYRILEKMVQKYEGHERITPCVAPHAPYTCSDATLKKAAEFARKHKLPISIHVSETKGEVEGSKKEYGLSPVKRLEKLGFLDDVHCVFAHCVHLDDDDIKVMAKKKVGAVHNPESNMKLGSGAARIPAMLEARMLVGIGTDGAASNNDLNLLKEMDTAAKLQKLVHSSNTAMTAIQALRMATREGAKALGLGDRIGTIEVGKLADLVVVDTSTANMQPMNDPVSQLVYSSTGTEIQTVVCNGQVIMEDWEVLTLNRRDVLTRAARYKEKSGF